MNLKEHAMENGIDASASDAPSELSLCLRD